MTLTEYVQFFISSSERKIKSTARCRSFVLMLFIFFYQISSFLPLKYFKKYFGFFFNTFREMMTNSTTVGRWIQICDRLWLSALERYPHHITTDRISDITQYRRVFLCISYLTVSLPLLSSPGNVFQTHGQDNSPTVLYKILSYISHPDYINVSDGEKGLYVDWKMWLQWKELSTCKMFWIVTGASLGLWVYVVWTTSLGLWWLGNIYALICKWCECSCRMM